MTTVWTTCTSAGSYSSILFFGLFTRCASYSDLGLFFRPPSVPSTLDGYCGGWGGLGERVLALGWAGSRSPKNEPVASLQRRPPPAWKPLKVVSLPPSGPPLVHSLCTPPVRSTESTV